MGICPGRLPDPLSVADVLERYAETDSNLTGLARSERNSEIRFVIPYRSSPTHVVGPIKGNETARARQKDNFRSHDFVWQKQSGGSELLTAEEFGLSPPGP